MGIPRNELPPPPLAVYFMREDGRGADYNAVFDETNEPQPDEFRRIKCNEDRMVFFNAGVPNVIKAPLILMVTPPSQTIPFPQGDSTVNVQVTVTQGKGYLIRNSENREFHVFEF